MIDMVEAYFAAVDGERLEDILALLSPDCVFSVPTHGVVLHGAEDISGMFTRLWAQHKAVRHLGFAHVADVDAGRIASQFRVENTEHDGSVTQKSNCNFFSLTGEKFSRVEVYMAGANTLDRAE
jgi:ketosteroid isomerase-like protein